MVNTAIRWNRQLSLETLWILDKSHRENLQVIQKKGVNQSALLKFQGVCQVNSPSPAD